MIIAAASPIWYWAIVIPYMFVLIGIGVWTYNFQKKQKTATDEHDDYWIAKRSNSALVVGCAIAAGWFLIGFITWAMANTYMYGIGGIWSMVVPWTVLLFTMVILVPNVRRFKAISQPQCLQQRFGLAVPRAFVWRRTLGVVHRLRGAGRGVHGVGRLPRGHQRQPAAVRHGRGVRHHRHHRDDL
jgi:Na+(H+)/acetate symporter ActP